MPTNITRHKKRCNNLKVRQILTYKYEHENSDYQDLFHCLVLVQMDLHQHALLGILLECQLEREEAVDLTKFCRARTCGDDGGVQKPTGK